MFKDGLNNIYVITVNVINRAPKNQVWQEIKHMRVVPIKFTKLAFVDYFIEKHNQIGGDDNTRFQLI